jgi:hypothetical protein
VSQQPEEAPLSKNDLEARIDKLWHEELEWVRQQPNPDLTDFNALIEKEKNKGSVGELPPLDIAMFPSDVALDIDINNQKKFNDRFLEQPIYSRASGLEKIILGFHNGMALLIALNLAFTTTSITDGFTVYFITLLFIAPFIYLFIFNIGKAKAGRIRYNRQAQLVHIDNGKGHVAHIPWRHVRVLNNIGIAPASIMLFCAPRSRADTERYKLLIRGNPNPPHLDKIWGIYSFGISLKSTDSISVAANLQRLEFIRRYMEHGIKAIQPHPDLTSKGLLADPERSDDPKQIYNAGGFLKYVLYPLNRIWHYFCFGPLLDRWARRSVEGFEWNEEVKNLCGPSPDLRGLNTRPVKSRTDVYYRPDGTSYRLVDRHGKALRFNQNQARRA